jgi:hypothetical protein
MRGLTVGTNQPPASTPCARNAPALSSPPAPSPSKPWPWSARTMRNAECRMQSPCGLTPAEIALMWQTAQHAHPPPGTRIP